VENSFLFQLPASFLSSGPEEAVVRFQIMDRTSWGDDQQLSAATLPLASLRGQVSVVLCVVTCVVCRVGWVMCHCKSEK
jgi:hypothetical protein